MISKKSQTIGALLQTFGGVSKEEPEAHALYYDFEPYHPDEPVLLAI